MEEFKPTHDPIVGMENPTTKIEYEGEASNNNLKEIKPMGDKIVLPKIKIVGQTSKVSQ